MTLDIERARVRRKVREALTGGSTPKIRVGAFELRARLGAGAMGLVYEAHDPRLDRLVALKILDPSAAGSERKERRARLLREARGLAKIDHPNVVRIFEVGVDHEQVFLAMERVEGPTLTEWLVTHDDLDEIIAVFAGAARGLQAMHDQMLVHRDFKPDNVIVHADGEARLIDFGLVRVPVEAPLGATSLTRTGVSVGTPAYMAPEQLRGDLADSRSDQFSFCVALYDALFHRSPFSGVTPGQRIASIVAGDLSPPPSDWALRFGRAPQVWAALERGLQPNPDARHASMNELINSLLSRLPTGGHEHPIADRYELRELLGAGGMGVVHRALDSTTGREVAIKLLPADQLEDPAASARLRHEARAAAALEHPGIVAVTDVGDTGRGGAYLVMELIEGRTLRELLESGPLGTDEVLRIIERVADALGAAHRAGIVHRDVKPDNIMIGDDGRVVLLDLGIAKTLPMDLATDLTALPQTDAGQVVGTTAYLAPEQARGQDVSGKTDQFALAVTAYEALTGRKPWSGDATAVLAQLVADDPAPPSKHAEVSPAIDAAVMRALSKNPAGRHDDIGAFARALRKAPARRTPSRGTLAMGVTLLVSGMAVAGFVLQRDLNGRQGGATERDGPAVVAIAPDEVVLACPILNAEGPPEPTGWLGAAAADLACRHATWTFGGNPKFTRTPAELLELPRQATDDYPIDPFEGDARERSMSRGRSLARFHLDGVVRLIASGFSLRLILRDAAGTEQARGEGRASELRPAVWSAMESIQSALPSADIDPAYAEWERFANVADGLLVAETELAVAMREQGAEELCRRLGERLPAHLPRGCSEMGVDKPTTALDRTTAVALAHTAVYGDEDELPSLARELALARESEETDIGRARLATAEALVLQRTGDVPSARTRLVEALASTPRSIFLRDSIVGASVGTTYTTGAARATLAWSPALPRHWSTLAWYGGGTIDQKREHQRRAYLLSGRSPAQAVHYVNELLRHGRLEDARTVSSSLASAEPPNAMAIAITGGLLDAAEARFASAIDRMKVALENRESLDDRASGSLNMVCLLELRRIAQVAGRTREIGDWFVERFVTEGLDVPPGMHMPFTSVCLYASPALAQRCIDVVRTGAPDVSGTVGIYAAFDEYALGAEHYARDDDQRAVDSWRSVVATGYYARNLPAAPFDAVGEHELAARIDRVQEHYRHYGGISLALPNAARRAARQGDTERARELATEVIEAWIVADRRVPAVEEMRTLLAEL